MFVATKSKIFKCFMKQLVFLSWEFSTDWLKPLRIESKHQSKPNTIFTKFLTQISFCTYRYIFFGPFFLSILNQISQFMRKEKYELNFVDD